jgi:hypothetical protein
MDVKKDDEENSSQDVEKKRGDFGWKKNKKL